MPARRTVALLSAGVLVCTAVAAAAIALPPATHPATTAAAPPSSATPAPSASPAPTVAPGPAPTTLPDLVRLLGAYRTIWVSDGRNDLHGRVVQSAVLERDDELSVWINRNATAAQRFRALQDTESAYDQSVTVSTGLGSVLGPLYVRGRASGALPRVEALINGTDGTVGAGLSTAVAKATFSHPRPFLPTDAKTGAVSGDQPACAPATTNASSLRAIRAGRPWADPNGNLRITRVAPVIDRTHAFTSHDVALDAAYGSTGICTGGSFPSGHTTAAYVAGITLATLLPELAPELLARASEGGNDRIVLGVHSPLDIVGGRIAAEAAIASRWSDPTFRDRVLLPARQELVRYLERACGRPLATCIADERPYAADPYGGRTMPGGTDQTVTDRASALAVYRERLTYGMAPIGPTDLPASVPAGAADLLRTAFPTLTDAQRAGVLAATQIPSGAPLDDTGAGRGSWERLDLAAAMSATVETLPDGGVRVVSTGGRPGVVSR